jgi:purine nucleosidase
VAERVVAVSAAEAPITTPINGIPFKAVKRNVVIDTDMGWDDLLALAIIAKDPDVNLLGVTVTGCGETHLQQGVEIAKSILALAGKSSVPVAAGADEPSQYNHKFPESFRATHDTATGMYNTKFLPKVDTPTYPKPAWVFMSECLEKQENQITFISLGGLTNIARLVEMKPQPKLENIYRLFIMGGAVYADGNVDSLNNSCSAWNQGPRYATNRKAEWNIFLDPRAMNVVLRTEIPITLVPLDACDYVIMDESLLKLVSAADPVARLIAKMLSNKLVDPEFKEAIPLPVFDPIAALIAVDKLHASNLQDIPILVVEEETDFDNTCGQTIIAPLAKEQQKLKALPILEATQRASYTADWCARSIQVALSVSHREFEAAFKTLANYQVPATTPIHKTAAILVFDRIEVLDYTGVFEVLGAARNADSTPVFKIVTVAPNEEPIRMMAGVFQHKEAAIKVCPDATFKTFTAKPDVLFVIGGQGVDKAAGNKELLRWVSNMAQQVDYVVGVCSGAIILAQAQLLNGLPATTHHTRFAQLRDLGKNIQVLDTRMGDNFVHLPGSKVMTSGGVHCGIAVAVHVVELYQGVEAAKQLAEDVLEYTIPRGISRPPAGFPQQRSLDPAQFVLGISHLNVIMKDMQMMEEATQFYASTLGFVVAWSVWLGDETSRHFAVDAGLGDSARLLVRFMVHPNAGFHIELMMYVYPTGDTEIHYRRTNDVGGIRHVALEVIDAVAAWKWLNGRPGVKLLSDCPPETLSPDPQKFFYWLDPYGVQWEFEEGRPMVRQVSGIDG